MDLMTITVKLTIYISFLIFFICIISLIVTRIKIQKKKFEQNNFVPILDRGNSMSSVDLITDKNKNNITKNEALSANKKNDQIKNLEISRKKCYSIYNHKINSKIYIHNQLHWYKNSA